MDEKTQGCCYARKSHLTLLHSAQRHLAGPCSYSHQSTTRPSKPNPGLTLDEKRHQDAHKQDRFEGIVDAIEPAQLLPAPARTHQCLKKNKWHYTQFRAGVLRTIPCHLFHLTPATDSQPVLCLRTENIFYANHRLPFKHPPWKNASDATNNPGSSANGCETQAATLNTHPSKTVQLPFPRPKAHNTLASTIIKRQHLTLAFGGCLKLLCSWAERLSRRDLHCGTFAQLFSQHIFATFNKCPGSKIVPSTMPANKSSDAAQQHPLKSGSEAYRPSRNLRGTKTIDKQLRCSAQHKFRGIYAVFTVS